MDEPTIDNQPALPADASEEQGGNGSVPQVPQRVFTITMGNGEAAGVNLELVQTIPQSILTKLQRRPVVTVLFDGHSRMEGTTGDIIANCSCTLIRGHKFNTIVDTMTPWDGDRICSALTDLELKPDNIQYVVCTHGHSDHTGNNNLFKNATHIVGFSMSYREKYFNIHLDKGDEFEIEPGVRVVPTPGHTSSDVSVLVSTGGSRGLVAITGDLFEREEDLEDPSLWRDLGGSEQPNLQQVHRDRILALADYIVPGHGPMFKNPTKQLDSASAASTSGEAMVSG